MNEARKRIIINEIDERLIQLAMSKEVRSNDEWRNIVEIEAMAIIHKIENM